MTCAKTLAAMALAGLMLPLSACSGGTDATADKASTTAADKSSKTLASVIAGQGSLSQVSGALSEVGLASVFDGPGSYTVLAPEDSAFAALGDSGKTLTDADHRPELVAVLRDHILPGALTAKAIETAITEHKGSVEMRTLGDSMVRFSQKNGKIVVTGADGSTATVTGQPIVASNGVVLPVDRLVKQATPAQ